MEYVVLVDEHNNPIGKMEKALVHTADTPLHRAFSVFVFNEKKQLLLQQRSSKKKTWPLIWSNSCCGHPAPGESEVDAAKRRLDFELGLTAENLTIILPGYRYRAELNGVVENEICPVLVASVSREPNVNPEEVEAVRWVNWHDFLHAIELKAGTYTPWCEEEAHLLQKEPAFQQFFDSI